jgi:hypothetical protein
MPAAHPANQESKTESDEAANHEQRCDSSGPLDQLSNCETRQLDKLYWSYLETRDRFKLPWPPQGVAHPTV